MELLQLQYFRTVARLEHLTKAAHELRIAQPALSKTISRLEEDLGVQLFDRRARQIRLNAFGKAFLKKTEAALALLEEGRKEVAELAGMEQGSIVLATTTLDRFSAPLGEFVSMHPEIHFRITQASLDEMGALLDNGDIDFMISAMPPQRPGIRMVPLLSEEVFLAVPPRHRFAQRDSISLKEAADDPFIDYKEGHPFRQMNDRFRRDAGMTPRIVCEVDEPAAIGSLVRAGLGVAFVGACKSDQATPLIKLPIEDPGYRRTFQLAWDEGRYMSKAAHKFREFLMNYFAGLHSSR
ncbi:LysR family transcriptional regulator [Paenibacillus allorhizosphaerae]|uniref:HTH-type transcriptional regulator GltC n=1 Tax=Paenibacillus allorhizosphaerae TaxID=2849866 RepID=A0ABM8VDE4_9BACL|nr:LysR family transcriptional regulator [Paenibacillus allorhizosphaerae]CAG7627196.1 HTH-type transcriptional regulator GltC [Paenibacillus allorhizosphaerae]